MVLDFAVVGLLMLDSNINPPHHTRLLYCVELYFVVSAPQSYTHAPTQPRSRPPTRARAEGLEQPHDRKLAAQVQLQRLGTRPEVEVYTL